MNLPIVQPDYAAHPMLDPHFLERDHIAARALARAYLDMGKSEEIHNRYLNRLLNPVERSYSLAENLEAARRYLVDVNAYIREVLLLLPGPLRKSLAMDAEVAARNEILGLFDLAFRGDTKRVRFEAQRKLYLAKLLFDVDHDPGVQMGGVHKAYFEKLLDRELWVGARRMKTVDVYYDIAADGMRVEINTRKTDPAQERWRFHVMRVRRPNRRAMHVYHYACRFKQEVSSFRYTEGRDEYEVEEKPIWETLHERRSGSILSKMVRKGEVHARKIQDIIGAMFIVKDLREVNDLQEVLFDIFGGPLRWKDRVNTITHPDDRARLNAYSGRGYEVLKSDVDVIYAPPRNGRRPYIFSVEMQIYTVEGFLRTVHSGHYASHQRLKLRQFLEGLLPYLYPTSVYGEAVIERCLDSVPALSAPAEPV